MSLIEGLTKEETEEQVIIYTLSRWNPCEPPQSGLLTRGGAASTRDQGISDYPQLSLPDLAFTLDQSTLNYMEYETAETTSKKKVSSNRLEESWSIMNIEFLFISD